LMMVLENQNIHFDFHFDFHFFLILSFYIFRK